MSPWRNRDKFIWERGVVKLTELTLIKSANWNGRQHEERHDQVKRVIDINETKCNVRDKV
jgi:hypothetical protein